MGLMHCETKWQGGMSFNARIRGHQILMDTRSAPGQDLGPSPKELLLASICGCSGIDVVSILQKMRTTLVTCDVNAESDTTEGYPSVFSEVKLKFLITGTDIKEDQAMRAVTLSMTKYCGVSAMVTGTSPMTYEVFLNNNKIGAGKAEFEAATSL